MDDDRIAPTTSLSACIGFQAQPAGMISWFFSVSTFVIVT
jgi:hypothetical protein